MCGNLGRSVSGERPRLVARGQRARAPPTRQPSRRSSFAVSHHTPFDRFVGGPSHNVMREHEQSGIARTGRQVGCGGMALRDWLRHWNIVTGPRWVQLTRAVGLVGRLTAGANAREGEAVDACRRRATKGGSRPEVQSKGGRRAYEERALFWRWWRHVASGGPQHSACLCAPSIPRLSRACCRLSNCNRCRRRRHRHRQR